MICYGGLFYHRIIGVNKVFIYIYFVSEFLWSSVNDSVCDSILPFEHLFLFYLVFAWVTSNSYSLCPHHIMVRRWCCPRYNNIWPPLKLITATSWWLFCSIVVSVVRGMVIFCDFIMLCAVFLVMISLTISQWNQLYSRLFLLIRFSVVGEFEIFIIS